MNTPPPSTAPRTSPTLWLSLIATAAGVLIIVSLAVVREVGKTARAGAQTLADVFKLHVNEHIKVNLNQSLTDLSGCQKLQLATVQTTELVDFTSEKVAEAGGISIGVDKGQALVSLPVTYTYSVDMQGEWKFFRSTDAQGREILLVQAPPLEPGKPATDLAKMQRYDLNNRLLGKEEFERQLKNRLQDTLDQAASTHVRELARAQARLELEHFMRLWLDQKLKLHERVDIRIRFADESLPLPPEAKPLY